MNPIFQLQRDISRYEADAIYYQDRAEHCRREAALLRHELEEERTGTRAALEDARERATMILKLDGLTGAEIEAAEKVLSGDSVQKAHIQRLREITINHSLLAYISYEEFA
jgi:hypothetical protein